jgi:hypothetical protein
MVGQLVCKAGPLATYGNQRCDWQLWRLNATGLRPSGPLSACIARRLILRWWQPSHTSKLSDVEKRVHTGSDHHDSTRQGSVIASPTVKLVQKARSHPHLCRVTRSWTCSQRRSGFRTNGTGGQLQLSCGVFPAVAMSSAGIVFVKWSGW